MFEPSDPDFIDALRAAGQASVPDSFASNVVRRSRRRRRLRVAGAIAAPSFGVALLIPILSGAVGSHGRQQDRLNVAAGSPRATTNSSPTASPTPEAVATEHPGCEHGATIDAVSGHGASSPLMAARALALPGTGTQDDIFTVGSGQAANEREVVATRNGARHVRFSVVQAPDGTWAVSSFGIAVAC